MNKRTLIFLIASLGLLGCNKSGDTVGKPGARRIAVIPKGATHEFWKSVEFGARKAGAELGVEILWKAPLKENDRAQQIAIVEQFATEGVHGIVVAPLDDVALGRPVSMAMAKQIPVVIIDSPLQGTVGKDFTNYVGTNNRKGGEMGAEALAKIINGKGKVLLFRYAEGSASTMEREAGFMDVMKKFPEISLLGVNRYGGATATEAQASALNMLDQIKEADAIFCSNESLTFGMLLALRQNNLIGKHKIVGFDTSGPLIEALKKGEVQALVAQNPKKMGAEAIKAMVAKLDGKSVPENVDSGAALVTAENVGSAEIAEILQNPL